jgi:hypothetical protein
VSRYLTTASSEFEADAIRGRLAEAGIPVIAQGAMDEHGIEFAHTRDVYVNDGDLERAREILKSDERFDEDELARLSEESYREATQDPPPLDEGASSDGRGA